MSETDTVTVRVVHLNGGHPDFPIQVDLRPGERIINVRTDGAYHTWVYIEETNDLV